MNKLLLSLALTTTIQSYSMNPTSLTDIENAHYFLEITYKETMLNFYSKEHKALTPSNNVCFFDKIPNDIKSLIFQYADIQSRKALYQTSKDIRDICSQSHTLFLHIQSSVLNKPTEPIAKEFNNIETTYLKDNKTFVKAIKKNNLDEVKTLRKNADLNFTAGFTGHTPLIEAVMKDNYQITQYLLTQKADPNIHCTNGNTALFLSKNTAMAELLITHNARVNIQNKKNGITPLFHFVNNNNPDIVKLLIAANADANIEVPIISYDVLTNKKKITTTTALERALKLDREPIILSLDPKGIKRKHELSNEESENHRRKRRKLVF